VRRAASKRPLFAGIEHSLPPALDERDTRLLRAFRQRFDRLSEVLDRATGWRIVAVPGLVPDHIFFEHLANRRFPVTWWIRRPDQMDYLQADNEMKTFASLTGGKAYFPRFDGELSGIFNEIGADLRNQYTIAYHPTNTKLDGTSIIYPWLPTNVAYVPSTEAIETVNIVTNTFNAEQGMAGGAADVAGLRWLAFAGWNADRVRAKSKVADLVEAVSRRADHADLYRAAERPGAGKSAAREFERLASSVVWRHGLFSIGPQWTRHPFRV